MRLEDCLAFSPINYLQVVARAHDMDTVMYSKSSLLQTILNRFRNTHFMRQAVENSLSEREKLALKIILFAGKGGGIAIEDAVDQVEQLLQVEKEVAQEAIAGIVSKGFVFKIADEYYEETYVVPSDLAEILIEIFLSEVNQQIAVLEEGPVEYREDGVSLLTDIFRFVAAIAKHETKLTQQGVIYKRAQKTITDGFVVQDESMEDERGYGLRFALILSYAEYRNLVKDEEGQFVVAKGLPSWLSMGAERQLRDVFEFWQTYYGRTNPYLDTFIAIMSRMPAKQWISYNEVAESLRQIIVDNVSAAYASQRGLQAMQQLLFMGVITVGFKGADFVFRITDIGKNLFARQEAQDWLPEEKHFFIQPNYEILVPQSIDKRVLWQIEELAELKKADQMMVYKLTKRSIYYALQQGWQYEQVLAYLRRHSKNELPQNVEFAINDWADMYGQMYVLDTCVVRCKSQKLAEEILSSTRLAKLVQGQITEQDLLILRDDYEDFLTGLQDEGYMPRVGLFRPNNEPRF